MKKSLLTVFTVLFLSALSFSQTNVTPGDGTLGAAIKAASSGAVLVLSSGGVYTESADSAFNIIGKEITIKAANGYTERPVIKNLSSLSGGVKPRPSIFILGANAGLILNGVEINGLEPDTTTYKSASNIINFLTGSSFHVKYVKIYNSLVKNPQSRIIDGSSSSFDPASGGFSVTLDTLIVDKSLFTNAQNVFDFKYVLLGDVQARNCTFWKILAGRVFRIMVPPDPTVLIDHCTFDAVNVANRCIDTKDNTKAWTIKNSSFSNSGATSSEIVRIYNALSVIKNCNFFNTGTTNVKLQSGATSSAITTADPKYRDAANGDFTLASDSPLLGKADDGKAIGDLRWDPTATSVKNESNEIPTGFTLYQNYPNPFNPATTIKFSISETGFISLKVFNLIGQEIGLLVNENLSAGTYSVSFDASNLPSGIYMYQLKTNGYTKTNKMMLMK